MTRILVVDNHDSFVHTLVGYLRELGAEVELIESDATDAAGLESLLPAFDAVMLSPGPGTPQDAGVSIDAVRIAARRRVPLLGVCLGHQAIGEAFGTPVTEAPELMHGMVSSVEHDGSALFDGIPSPFDVGRYHSLALPSSSLPAWPGVRPLAHGGSRFVCRNEGRQSPGPQPDWAEGVHCSRDIVSRPSTFHPRPDQESGLLDLGVGYKSLDYFASNFDRNQS